jgi:hypothetical protein
MKVVESSAVFQPKQWAREKKPGRIENRTQPELLPIRRQIEHCSRCPEFVHSEDELQQFIQNYDHPGRALYRTVAQLKQDKEAFEADPNHYRCKRNVSDLLWIFGETDFKDHPDIPPEEIQRRLLAMQPAPTMLVASGHGLHSYWRLKQREDASEEGAGAH